MADAQQSEFAVHPVRVMPHEIYVSEENLINGIRLFAQNCAVCPGSAKGAESPSPIAKGLQIWTLALFLKHMDKLPPAVQRSW